MIYCFDFIILFNNKQILNKHIKMNPLYSNIKQGHSIFQLQFLNHSKPLFDP